MPLPKLKYMGHWQVPKDIFIKRYGKWTSLTESPPLPLTSPVIRAALKTQLIINNAASITATPSIITNANFNTTNNYLDAIATSDNKIVFVPADSTSKILVLNCSNDSITAFTNTTGIKLRGSYHENGSIYMFGQQVISGSNGWFPVYKFNTSTGELKRISWSMFVLRNCFLGPGGGIWGEALPIVGSPANVNGGIAVFNPLTNLVGGIGFMNQESNLSNSFNVATTYPALERMYDSDGLYFGNNSVSGEEQQDGRVLFTNSTANKFIARTANYSKFVDSIIYDNIGFSVPYNLTSTNVLRRNESLTTQSSINFTTGSNLVSGNQWNRGIIGPNGRIYFSPRNHNNIMEINQHAANSQSFTGLTLSAGQGWGQGAMSINNNIYFCPMGSGNIAKITFTGTFTRLPKDQVLSTWIQQQ